MIYRRHCPTHNTRPNGRFNAHDIRAIPMFEVADLVGPASALSCHE